jgi:hypothetical protein
VKFTLVTNSVLLFLVLLLFDEFLLGMSETSPCSVSPLHVNTILLLDAVQLLMLSLKVLTYFETKEFLLIILYN